MNFGTPWLFVPQLGPSIVTGPVLSDPIKKGFLPSIPPTTPSHLIAENSAAVSPLTRHRSWRIGRAPHWHSAADIAGIAAAAYAEGGTDLLRLLDAERARLDAELAWARGMVDYREHASEQYTILGTGRAVSLAEFGNIILAATNGTPVLYVTSSRFVSALRHPKGRRYAMARTSQAWSSCSKVKTASA